MSKKIFFGANVFTYEKRTFPFGRKVIVTEVIDVAIIYPTGFTVRQTYDFNLNKAWDNNHAREKILKDMFMSWKPIVAFNKKNFQKLLKHNITTENILEHLEVNLMPTNDIWGYLSAVEFNHAFSKPKQYKEIYQYFKAKTDNEAFKKEVDSKLVRIDYLENWPEPKGQTALDKAYYAKEIFEYVKSK